MLGAGGCARRHGIAVVGSGGTNGNVINRSLHVKRSVTSTRSE